MIGIEGHETSRERLERGLYIPELQGISGLGQITPGWAFIIGGIGGFFGPVSSREARRDDETYY